MAESDKSKIVQQMGGTENLMNMSEAERKAAALKMANELRSNPGLYQEIITPVRMHDAKSDE